jgi:hypothetical protein
VLSQQLQNAKMQADAAHGALKQADDLKPVFEVPCWATKSPT